MTKAPHGEDFPNELWWVLIAGHGRDFITDAITGRAMVSGT